MLDKWSTKQVCLTFWASGIQIWISSDTLVRIWQVWMVVYMFPSIGLRPGHCVLTGNQIRLRSIKKRKEKKLWWSYWQNSIYNCLARQLHLTKIAKCMSNNNQHTAKLLDLHTWEPKIYQICWSLFGWVPPTAQKHQGVTNLFGTRYITLAILIHAMGYLFDRHIWNYIFVQTTLNIFLTIIPDIYLWDNSISALSTNQETTQLHVLAYR